MRTSGLRSLQPFLAFWAELIFVSWCILVFRSWPSWAYDSASLPLRTFASVPCAKLLQIFSLSSWKSDSPTTLGQNQQGSATLPALCDRASPPAGLETLLIRIN